MPPAPELHTFADTQELVQAAADLLVQLGQRAIAERNRFLVALSGGSTPKTLYATLTSPTLARRLDWTKVHFFFGDERCVPPEHPESNFGLAQAMLFAPLHIPPSSIHRIQGEDLPEAAAISYETLLRRLTAKPEEPWPVFDLVLLGMGDDGHTASLFPGTPAVSESTRWVVPSSAPQGARSRITITLGVINHASVILFLVTGHKKATVVQRILEKSADDPSPYPAALVRPERGRLLWYLDCAAASKLTTTPPHSTSHEDP
ncbi:MAG: 6-phosphogluconolactonase [Nitrospira sp.]|nr:6-phosphogluconolactonase [Nitrospira sp.]